jgi:hypothetical protein
MSTRTDLVLLLSSDYSNAPHMDTVVRKATMFAALLLRAFSTHNEKFFMRLFKIFELEYVSPVWNLVAVGLTHDPKHVQRPSQNNYMV